MKVAVWHNLYSGGGKRALNYHIKALKESGHQIEVWTPDTSFENKLQAVDAEIKQHVHPLQEQLQKIKYPRFGFQFYQYIKKRNELIKKHCAACAEEINSGGFDLLFANACRYNYMSFMSLYTRIPGVIYLNEPFRPNYEAAPNLVWAAPENKLSFAFLKNHVRLIPNRIQVLEEVIAARRYNKILVNSMYSRESVMKSYGLDSEVCYLGIDDSFFSHDPNTVQKKPYVVTVGFISYLKGIDRVIRCIAKVPSGLRPKLISIGTGAHSMYKQEIETLARDLKVKLEININMGEEEMKRIVSEAAAMIYMPRLEPFGFAPLEANALGTAVVGIAEGGVRETIIHNKNGFLINHEDYQLAGEYIAILVQDPGYALKMGLQSKEHVKQCWNFKNLSKNIESSLEDLLTKNS